MAAHRYWRFNITATVGSQPAGIAEVSMASSPGGANLLGSGTPSASSIYSGSYPASNACDGNPTTFWSAATITSWWQYDFGAGNAYDIREFKITARNDTNQCSQSGWTLQWSDNGSAWSDACYYIQPTWTAGQTQTFAVPQPGAAHRIWRFNIASTQNNFAACMAEVTMATSPGGANVLGSGTPSASSIYSGSYAAAYACDGNPATFWSAVGPTGFGAWWQYDFGAGNSFNIQQVTIQIRNDNAEGSSPANWTLQASDDGIGFVDISSFTAATWTTNGQIQTFTLPQQGQYFPAACIF
jgi:hypothetical protein